MYMGKFYTPSQSSISPEPLDFIDHVETELALISKTQSLAKSANCELSIQVHIHNVHKIERRTCIAKRLAGIQLHLERLGV